MPDLDLHIPRAWDRLHAETPKSFDAFQTYLKLGRDRSLDAVAIALNPATAKNKRASSGRLALWSSRYRWVERARGYDDHLAEAAEEEERHQLQLDISEAAARRREYRARAAKLAHRLHERLEASIDATPKPSPKEIRELVLAGERLGLVEARAFGGLPVPSKVEEEQDEPIDPAIARAIEMAKAGLGDAEPAPWRPAVQVV